VGFVLALAFLCALTCVPGLSKSYPWNYALLTLFTFCYSIPLSYLAAYYNTVAFAIALCITLVVVLALTVFAFQTRYDFSGCGTYLFAASIVLIVFGIIAAILHNRVLEIVYAAIGALVFSMYIVMDTQKIAGGKHVKYQFSIDDYVFAAVTLYIDIMALFTFILTLVGAVGE